MVDLKPDLKKGSAQLISNYFGEEIAKLYEKNFSDKDDKTVLVILDGLLSEYLGDAQAKEEIKKLTDSLS